MAGLMVVLMLSAPLSGCFGEDSPGVSSTELKVNPEALIAGEFQPVSLRADSRMWGLPLNSRTSFPSATSVP